ncbi:hypothetical protein SVAN01_06516 [Stagonosporopsis vannaccii]|nr:hypothetical protein SVAN01_06516 [Stagonosporopsis vannaccii]
MSAQPNGTNNMESPGLIAGHAQYVKGAAEVCPSAPPPPLPYTLQPPLTEAFHFISPTCSPTHTNSVTKATIGSVTGNQAWATSGEQDKSQAIDAMKAASENRDPSQQGLGGVEQAAGNLVGCEGMQKEGAESKKQ